MSKHFKIAISLIFAFVLGASFFAILFGILGIIISAAFSVPDSSIYYVLLGFFIVSLCPLAGSIYLFIASGRIYASLKNERMGIESSDIPAKSNSIKFFFQIFFCVILIVFIIIPFAYLLLPNT